MCIPTKDYPFHVVAGVTPARSFYLLLEVMMQPIYLLAIVRKRRDKTSKLTRIAKCDFCNDAIFEGQKTGEWWSVWVYDSPIKAISTLFFIGRDMDPGIRGAELLSEMLTSSLSRFSGQKWEVEACGPIDADDAVSLRIELEVV